MIPKLAFLFLTITDVHHETMWKSFFAKHEPEYSVYVHSKSHLSKESFFKPYEIAKKIPTTWANTMLAQRELLREALKDIHNEKFVFVSESTIPLKSFETVYKTLMSHSKSQFNFWPNPDTYRTFGNITGDALYKNAQWVVLNRKHAELMATDDLLIRELVKGPHDQEHYPSTFLAQKGLLHEVVKLDTTFAVWHVTSSNKHPYSFKDELIKDPLLARLLKAIKSDNFLFARKFGKGCDLSCLPLAL